MGRSPAGFPTGRAPVEINLIRWRSRTECPKIQGFGFGPIPARAGSVADLLRGVRSPPTRRSRRETRAVGFESRPPLGKVDPSQRLSAPARAASEGELLREGLTAGSLAARSIPTRREFIPSLASLEPENVRRVQPVAARHRTPRKRGSSPGRGRDAPCQPLSRVKP